MGSFRYRNVLGHFFSFFFSRQEVCVFNTGANVNCRSLTPPSVALDNLVPAG